MKKKLPETTTAPIAPGNFQNVASEFGRTPDAQRQYGLKRGTLYNLYKDGKIRGVTLRVRGQKSGVRLWDMASIASFIHSQMEASKQ